MPMIKISDDRTLKVSSVTAALGMLTEYLFTALSQGVKLDRIQSWGENICFPVYPDAPRWETIILVRCVCCLCETWGRGS